MEKIDSKNTIDFLSNVTFFSNVSRSALSLLEKDLVVESYLKGKPIINKGDSGDSLYVIKSGKVKVHDNNHIYGHLQESDCFGEYALIDNQERSASVTTLERTVVFKIGKESFFKLMKKDSGLAKGILEVLTSRNRDLDNIQERLATSKEELELLNSKMKGLIEGAMDAIIMFDSNYRILLANPSAHKLLENDDVLQRNVLFFFDETSAAMIEEILTSESSKNINSYLTDVIRVIGSNNTETINEGTLSKHGSNEAPLYTLILRNIEDRIHAENTINLLTKQTQYLEEEIKELTSNYGIVAEHISMKTVLEQIEQVARTDATVLITGETGTGKELVARALHKTSNRNDKPLIRINCGAIPANLIESELFGHKKGAFTGATADRKGRFLLADKGTIFLDEIGEMPLELQPKLLRVIQEGEFDPVGSSETINVDVRIIAATHRDLLRHAEKGEFREDLYYRLHVFPIKVPALRDRGNDVCVIAKEMINQLTLKLSKPIIQLNDADKNLFINYDWPGNVRELQNLIERAIIISNKGRVNWEDIIPSTSNKNVEIPPEQNRVLTSRELHTIEKNNILKALKQTRWKISGVNGAANLLGIPPTTLASKIKAFGLERPV